MHYTVLCPLDHKWFLPSSTVGRTSISIQRFTAAFINGTQSREKINNGERSRLRAAGGD
jgi:hypothetical protein